MGATRYESSCRAAGSLLFPFVPSLASVGPCSPVHRGDKFQTPGLLFLCCRSPRAPSRAPGTAGTSALCFLLCTCFWTLVFTSPVCFECRGWDPDATLQLPAWSTLWPHWRSTGQGLWKRLLRTCSHCGSKASACSPHALHGVVGAAAPSAGARSQAAPRPLLQLVWAAPAGPAVVFQGGWSQREESGVPSAGTRQREVGAAHPSQAHVNLLWAGFYVGVQCPSSPPCPHGCAAPCQEVRAQRWKGTRSKPQLWVTRWYWAGLGRDGSSPGMGCGCCWLCTVDAGWKHPACAETELS